MKREHAIQDIKPTPQKKSGKEEEVVAHYFI